MADWPLITVRFAVYLALAVLFGLSAFSLYGLRAGERGEAFKQRRWLVASATVGLLFSAVWLLLMVAAMAGTPLWPVDREAADALLAGSAVGAAWTLRMIALAIATFAAISSGRSAIWLGTVVLSAAIALGTLAWTGHGAMDDTAIGWVHLAADILHLIASGAWVGALLGLILLVARPAPRIDAAHLRLTHRALHGFGAVGTAVVGTIVITGLINGWTLVGIGNIVTLGATLYGQLLLAKLALFVAMLGLASLNRFRLTPAFELSISLNDEGRALRVLRVSLAVETACIVVILALVAWLGTLEPPTSAM